MSDRTEGGLTVILYISLIIVLFFVLLNNLNDPWVIVSLCGLFIVSITVRNALIYESPRLYKFGKLGVLLDIALIYWISTYDRSGNASIYYFILIGDTVIAYSNLFGGITAVLSYFAYLHHMYSNTNHGPLLGFISGMVLHSLAFIAVTGVMYIVKHEIRQRKRFREMMYELKVKTKQLDNAYVKLKKASEELEEMTILKERNRIAREIHDTVGHILTNALIGIEAGECLMEVDTQSAREKFSLAKEQVRKGIGDIRSSVRMLKSGREIMEFTESLKLLLEETSKSGEIFIKHDIGAIPQLTDQLERTIYRALQEGLTNGIRHGKSTAFVFILKCEKERLEFILQDNGSGSDKITFGFGLAAMEERVKELAGVLDITSGVGEGFGIHITLPLKKEDLQEHDTGLDS